MGGLASWQSSKHVRSWPDASGKFVRIPCFVKDTTDALQGYVQLDFPPPLLGIQVLPRVIQGCCVLQYATRLGCLDLHKQVSQYACGNACGEPEDINCRSDVSP